MVEYGLVYRVGGWVVGGWGFLDGLGVIGVVGCGLGVGVGVGVWCGG